MKFKLPAKTFFSKKKKPLIIVAILIVLISGVSFFFFKANLHKIPDMQLSAAAVTAKIQRQTLTNSISATGTVESAETKTVNTALSNLEVSAVYVKEGDYVEEGTVICEFDAGDFKEELAKAQNNYSVNQQINALEDDYQTIYDETIADANETLQNLRDARDYYRQEYNTAMTAEEAAKAAYETALAECQAVCQKLNISFDPDALNNLLKDEKNSEIDASLKSALTAFNEASSNYETARQTSAQWKSAYESAQEEREHYQDTYEETIAKAEYDYNKAVLEEKLISETQEEKTISEYKEKIEDCVIRAAISGVITSLNVTKGNNFEGGNIYTIQDNDHFIVSASVDEYDIISIEKGMSAYIKTDATGDEEMLGTVTYVAIAPESGSTGTMGAVSSSGSYRIEVSITDPNENLRAGMTGKISIALEESKDTLTVPYDAVTTTPHGSTITVDDNGEKKTVSVETGLETDYYTEIFSDEISEGMTVYLSTPMIQRSSDPNKESGFQFGIMGGGIPSDGRDKPSRSGGSDRPSGGGPGGF
ncbi:MAG: efflux RND transporter periplasmic adaptor subunit [Lachnospiraceae bacterium]